MLIKNTVFLFDVDGTLTPARQEITPEFLKYFTDWMTDKRVYLVSGSDLEKIKGQLSEDILSKTEGIFTASGNCFHTSEGELIYSKTFDPPRSLLDFLNEHLNHKSEYKLRFGNHIEPRSGMINFSVVGRNANKEERDRYHDWDTEHGERKYIARHIKETYADIEAVIGGEISVDIYPKGDDKSQVLQYINADKYIFFGDKTLPGGNDYPLAHALEKKTSFLVHGFTGFEQTWKILESLYSSNFCTNEECGTCECE